MQCHDGNLSGEYSNEWNGNLDPGIGSGLYDYDAWLRYFDHHGLNLRNLCLSVDDLER